MIRITKPIENVTTFLQQSNYTPQATFILTDIIVDLAGAYRTEKNSLYNRKKLITEIQDGILQLENVVLLSSAEKESFMVDFVDELKRVQPNILITYIPNVIRPIGNYSMYYHVLHVYSKQKGSTTEALDLNVVAINKCYSKASYDMLLRSQPEFVGKKILGFTEEDVLDQYEVMDTKDIQMMI